MLKILRKRTLQIEVSTACNLDCPICLRRVFRRPKRFFPLDSFKRIIPARGFRYVGLHGWGEPMLHPQLFEMVRYAESAGLITNLTTNGTLIGERLEEIFESGLQEIAIGVYEEGLLLEVLPQVERLIKERENRASKRPRIYLDITLYEGNRERVPAMIRLGSQVGIDAVILHRLFHLYGVDSYAQPLSAAEEERLFKEVKAVARELKIGLYLPERHSYPCRIVKRSLFIRVDGIATPCTYLIEEDLGDALKVGLDEILRSDRYRSFIKGMERHPICSECRW